MQFYDVEEAPFQIHGVFKENGMFRRMPEAVARSVSQGVYEYHTHTAGGRVRFVTDSPSVALRTEYIPMKMDHFALTGSAGFDLYTECQGETWYEGTFRPPVDVTDGYEAVVNLLPGTCDKRTVTINFPLYSSVKKLSIGLEEGAVLEAAPAYRINKPVVYYGSSITQGGCASKPGSTYQSILSSRYDCDYINLGFSGNAKGEGTMAEYIKSLDMSVFVLDYDYNALTAKDLEDTHSRMYEAIRLAHPELPIVIMGKPRLFSRLPREEQVRALITRATYDRAKAQGDENVYYVSGDELMALVGNNGLVDGAHPTDSGFFSMAQALGSIFDKIFGVSEVQGI